MTEYNVCLICSKPLGAESKDAGFPFCHEHRKCQRCNEDLAPYEAKAILETFNRSIDKEEKETGETIPIEKRCEYLLMDVIHPACRINDPTAMVSIRASEYKFLNLIRNLVMPETDCSIELNGIRSIPYGRELVAEMEYDKLARTLERMERISSLIRIAIMQDPDHKKKQIADKITFEKAAKAQIASTSPKETKEAKEPKESHQPSEKEIAYQVFLLEFKLSDSQESKKTFSNWFKTVKGWQTAGIPFEEAKNMASVALRRGLNQ
jgi:hypothetical protein